MALALHAGIRRNNIKEIWGLRKEGKQTHKDRELGEWRIWVHLQKWWRERGAGLWGVILYPSFGYNCTWSKPACQKWCARARVSFYTKTWDELRKDKILPLQRQILWPIPCTALSTGTCQVAKPAFLWPGTFPLGHSLRNQIMKLLG